MSLWTKHIRMVSCLKSMKYSEQWWSDSNMWSECKCMTVCIIIPVTIQGVYLCSLFCRYKAACDALGLQNDQLKFYLVYILGSTGFLQNDLVFLHGQHGEQKVQYNIFCKSQSAFCRLFQFQANLGNHLELYRCFKNHFVVVQGGHRW